LARGKTYFEVFV